MNKLIIFLKTWHILPVYRRDVLRYLKHHCEDYAGICQGIEDVCKNVFRIANYVNTSALFPEHCFSNAKPFTDKNSYPSGYWWPADNWSTGRMEYLDWLIEQYKDDKTNLTHCE